MDEASFRRFDDLRRRHFPPARNFLRAHLTLFHHLPGDAEAEARAALAEAAERPAPTLAVTGVRSLGRGVAYVIESEALHAARSRIAARFADRLTPQDRQGFRPHVTVQNKVEPAQAAALHAELSAAFSPFEARATALLLWRYLGGPWEAAGAFPFAAP